jgi:hypothetical protein
MAEKISSLQEDQKLYRDSQRELDQAYQEMFSAAIEAHGAKLISDLDALLRVSFQHM